MQDTINLQDFDWDEESSMYTYSCRCGGSHELTKTEVVFRVDLVPCDSCSLCLRVLYDGVDLSGLDAEKT